MPELMDEFGRFLVALIRVRVHRLPQNRIDPDGNLAALVERGAVGQLSLLRPGPGLRHLGAVGQPAGQQLIGDDAE